MIDSVSHPEQTDPIQMPVAPRRRRPWLRLLLYLVIFVSGAVVGAGGTVLAMRRGALFAVHHPDEMPARIAARMAKVLSLSDDQTVQVERTLQERKTALQSIRREFQPQVEEQLDLLEQQVSTVLTDQQRETWHARIAHLRRTWVPKLPPE